MPVISFCKTPDEATANVLLTKFFERLQINSDGTAISVLEFIIQVKDDSALGLSILDIIIPHTVSETEEVTETFGDIDLFDNQVYTKGLILLDADEKKYSIDGIEASLTSLLSPPKVDVKDNSYTEMRIRFNKIIPGKSGAFRLKTTIPNFANIYESLGNFEFSLYYSWALPGCIEKVKEYGVNGIPINRKFCEIWVILPENTFCGKAIPTPQQIKVRHAHQLCSNDRIDPPRSAVYWDLGDTVFDLAGRPLGAQIRPDRGVRIYCETNKPHVAAKTFETKIKTTLDAMEHLKKSANAAEDSLNFIAQHGKKSLVITFSLSAIAIILAIISLTKGV